MRIKTQNMIVLTLEFTRTPLSCLRIRRWLDPQQTIHLPVRRLNLSESGRKYTPPLRQTQQLPAWMCNNPDCTPKEAGVTAI